MSKIYQSKEEVYDERISGLMTQIIEVCQERGIAMVASFDISTSDNPDFLCTTALPDEGGKHPEKFWDFVCSVVPAENL